MTPLGGGSAERAHASIVPVLLNTEQAAQYLGLSVRHVRWLRQQERIPYTKLGRAVRYHRDDLDYWVAENTRYPS